MQDKTNNALDYNSLTHPFINIMSKVRYRARKNMFNLFMKIIQPTEPQTILDMGVTPDETQEESNFFEAFYPYKHRITAASIEDASFLEQKYKGLKFIQIDGSAPFPFIDNEFDILFCNAVLEHVGNTEKQKIFLSECSRISKNFFLTTPNRWYPIEVHTAIPFLHYLPKRIFRKILKLLKNDFFADENNLNLLSRREIADILPCKENTIIEFTYIKTFLFTSNIIIYGKTCEI